MSASAPRSPEISATSETEMHACGSASASMSPKTSSSRKKVAAGAPPSPKTEATAAKKAKVAKFSLSKIARMGLDMFFSFWIMFYTYVVAGFCFFLGFPLTKTGLHKRMVTAISGFPTAKPGVTGRVDLKQLGFTIAYVVYACTFGATAYSHVKAWLPSLVWSEPVATLYIMPACDFSALLADRLLVVADTKADQCIYILGHPVETVKMAIAGCMATTVGAGRWTATGLYNFFFNKGWFNPLAYSAFFANILTGASTYLYNLVSRQAWTAWINPAAYLPYFTAMIAGMPSSRAGTRGRVAMTRLNFVASIASNLSLTATGMYVYARTWVPNFLAAILKSLEDGVMLYATPFIVFADDICDKLLTAADMKLNAVIGFPFTIAANLIFAVRNPGTSITTVIAMCWAPVYVAVQWVTRKVVPASYLAACVKLYGSANLASFPSLAADIWKNLPASSYGRWALVTTVGMIITIHDIIVPMALYKNVLDLCVYVVTAILASGPGTMLVNIVHPRVAFFLDPLYNMAITSKPIIECVKYWAPVAAAAVAVVA